MKKKVLNIEFGSRIKELRYNLPKRDGNIVLQREVAKEAGISISSYQQAEKGIVPGKSILYSLSNYFNVTVDYLKGEEVDHAPEVVAAFRESKSELQDGEGLWGKTRQHNVEGTPPLTVTEFKPKEGQVKGPLRAAIEGLGEIFDSNDPILIPTIQAKIHAFQLAARREHQNTQQARQIKVLQDECDELKKRIDALEKTCAETSTPGPEGGDINRKVM